MCAGPANGCGTSMRSHIDGLPGVLLPDWRLKPLANQNWDGPLGGGRRILIAGMTAGGPCSASRPFVTGLIASQGVVAEPVFSCRRAETSEHCNPADPPRTNSFSRAPAVEWRFVAPSSYSLLKALT